MNNILTWLLLILIFTFLTNCTERQSNLNPPETPSKVLNDFVRSAPFQYIDLDAVRSEVVEVGEEDIVYSIHNEKEGEPLLGSIASMIKVKDRFYINDFSGKSVFEVNTEGKIIGPLTRQGKGPGEQNTSGKLLTNSEFIYVPDANNARINRYTPNMDIADALQGFMYSMEVDLNDDQLLVQNRHSNGFAPAKPEEGLIVASALNNLEDTLATFMPRIIPAGYQPGVYNRTKFSIDRNSKIAASYFPLPWFFLFDQNHNHLQTLILEYSIFQKMDIPSMEFFKPKGNEGFGGTMPISGYKLMDNGDIFMTIAYKTESTSYTTDGTNDVHPTNNWELIKLSASHNGTYKIAGKYRFKYTGKENAMRGRISPPIPSDEENEFYAHNNEYLFKFFLPHNN